MELPDLGKHCHQKQCKKLDFLPMKCDACSEIFCNDHIHYTSHSCTESYKKDNQVPVCPLCNKPIPLKKGEVVDVVVGRHIDSDCQSDPAKERRKVYSNKCSMKGCKVKEMIPVKCDRCHKNFCLRHRFEDDHKCEGFEGSGQGMSRAGAAALSRFPTNTSSQSKSKPKQMRQTNPAPQQRSQLANVGRELDRERQERQQQGRQVTDFRSAQGGLSNEEALARAIQESLTSSQQPNSSSGNQNLSQEDEDLLLAQALAASEEEARRETNRRRQQQQQQQQQQQENKKSCEVS